MLQVNEIFYSIQGEALWTGLPCVFVRLSGCNLRCCYCDTPYAYDPGQDMTLDEVVAQAETFQCPRLTLTGGEPLLQKEAPKLVARLIDNGYAVSIETNGSISIAPLDRRCVKIVDIKCPSSGMQHLNHLKNIALLGTNDQLKFVIADRTDFDFATSMLQRCATHVSPERTLFSPVHRVLPPEQLASWILDQKVAARLQIQLHKLLWPDRDKGV
jgi:7-carboxy-7-deazaguanine synthase